MSAPGFLERHNPCPLHSTARKRRTQILTKKRDGKPGTKIAAVCAECGRLLDVTPDKTR